MSAITFAIAFRTWLENRQRSEVESPEPIPDDYGLTPDRNAEGRRLRENPLAEELRKAVKRDFDEDVMKRVNARRHFYVPPVVGLLLALATAAQGQRADPPTPRSVQMDSQVTQVRTNLTAEEILRLNNFWDAYRYSVVSNEVRSDPLQFSTTLSTNWLPLSLSKPNGDGSVRFERWEIGVVVSNRYAAFVADGITNRVLVSSGILAGVPMVREAATFRISGVLTNTNFQWIISAQ